VAASDTRSSTGWGWFLAWFFAGALCALAVLGALTIGIFVLPIAGVLIVFLATRRHAVDGVAGLISGLGLPVLFVAYLNRDGPGNICTSTATSTTCMEEWSPWPWLLIGVGVIALGVAVFVWSTRRRAARGVD
jgi:hypothetical protein